MKPSFVVFAICSRLRRFGELGSASYGHPPRQAPRPFRDAAPAPVGARGSPGKDDVDVMVGAMAADAGAGSSAIFVYRSNADLRAHFREWPARGKAAGGFVGPHRVAAMCARDMLDEDGIDVDLLFGPA